MKKILTCVLLSFLYLSVNYSQSFGFGVHFGNSPNCINTSEKVSGINTTIRTNEEETWEEKNRCFSFGGSLNYYANPTTIFRVKVLVEVINLSNVSDNQLTQSNSNRFSSLTSSQRNIEFAPSIIWEMGSTSFRPRVGLELPITVLGNLKSKFEAERNEENRNGDRIETFMSKQLSENEIIAGTTFGLGLILGGSYRFNRFLALNAELSPRIVYSNYTSSTQGKFEFNQITEIVEGENLIDRNELNFNTNNSGNIEEKVLELLPTIFDIALVFNF